MGIDFSALSGSPAESRTAPDEGQPTITTGLMPEMLAGVRAHQYTLPLAARLKTSNRDVAADVRRRIHSRIAAHRPPRYLGGYFLSGPLAHVKGGGHRRPVKFQGRSRGGRFTQRVRAKSSGRFGAGPAEWSRSFENFSTGSGAGSRAR